jgi:hypothetical protein
MKDGPPLVLSIACVAIAACANQTTFHIKPADARVYVNGEPCGQIPCVYHSRYGFPDRIRVQIEKEGYQSAEFFLDTEPPLLSYFLEVVGSYLFHTYPEEYRFELRPVAAGPPAAKPAAGARLAVCVATTGPTSRTGGMLHLERRRGRFRLGQAPSPAKLPR